MLIGWITVLWAVFVIGSSSSSSQHSNIDVILEFVDSCKTAAKFNWMIFGHHVDSPGINCSVRYSHASSFNSSLAKERPYLIMKTSGSFILQGLDSLVGRQFSVQLQCGDAASDIITFVVNDKKLCNGTDDQTNTDGPVMFKDESSILGTRDSLLGILFGLFGLLIIIVTTFYVVRKIRRRNRLERIRRYLGSSLIDPFENLQSRIDTDRDTGSESLMGSTDRLYLHRSADRGFNTENTD